MPMKRTSFKAKPSAPRIRSSVGGTTNTRSGVRVGNPFRRNRAITGGVVSPFRPVRWLIGCFVLLFILGIIAAIVVFAGLVF